MLTRQRHVQAAHQAMTTAPLLTLPCEHPHEFASGSKANSFDLSTKTNMTISTPTAKPEASAASERASDELQSPDGDGQRGRRRNRDGENGDDASGDEGSSKKRRRSRKGLDKKFECPHVGCGKSYSRAEHLYRHQLNRKFPPTFPTHLVPHEMVTRSLCHFAWHTYVI